MGVPDEAPPTESMPARFQVEVAPLQSVFIDADRIFIFRRIVIDDRIYRQGLTLKIDTFLAYLADTYFSTQPMSRFSPVVRDPADCDRCRGACRSCGYRGFRYRPRHPPPRLEEDLRRFLKGRGPPHPLHRRNGYRVGPDPEVHAGHGGNGCRRQ